MVIIDERDFADAKAVAGRDAGCRLEVRIELRPKAAVGGARPTGGELAITADNSTARA